MSSAQHKALEQLQRHSATLPSQTELSGWTVHTGKHGLYYLHEDSGLTFQTLGAAKVAVVAFSHTAASDRDDEDDEREEVLSIATCLDAVVSHLHRHKDSLQAYNREAPGHCRDTQSFAAKDC